MALSAGAQAVFDQLAAAPGTFVEYDQIAGAALDEVIAAGLAMAYGPSFEHAYISFFRPQGPQPEYRPVGLTYEGKVQAGLPLPPPPPY
jgi:hypothetical protein